MLSILFQIFCLAAFSYSSLAKEQSELCGEQDGIDKFGSLIYDVTLPFKDKPQGYFCNHSIESCGMQVCSQSYYRFSPSNYTDIPCNLRRYFKELTYNRSYHHVEEIGLMFGVADTCDVYSLLSNECTVGFKYYPDAIIIKRAAVGQECIDYCVIINDLLTGIYFHGKGGLELNEWQLDCLTQSSLFVFSYSDVTVLNVELSPITSMLSYPSFVKRLTKILDEKAELVIGQNPTGKFYFRVSVTEYSTDILEKKNSYRAYFAKYADTWVRKEIMAQVVLDSFPKSERVGTRFESNFSNIYPYIKYGTNEKRFDFETSCQLPRGLEIFGKVFQNIWFDIFRGSSTAITAKCNTTAPSNRNITSTLTIMVTMESQAIDLIKRVKYRETDLRFQTIFVQPTSLNISDLMELLSYADPQNISIGCNQEYSHYQWGNGSFSYNTNGLLCKNWFEKRPLALLEWSASFSVTYHDHLSYLLNTSLKLRRNFLEKYPKATMYTRLYLLDSISSQLTEYFRLNLYCAVFLTSYQELQQAITNWSQIHDFVVIMTPLVDGTYQSGWWFNVVTETDLNRTITDFPVLVRRNVPETITGNSSAPNAYPCIHWSKHLFSSSSSEIKCEDRIYSGITINLNRVSRLQLVLEDIQNILAYGFGRFASVEIRGNITHVSKISDVLASNLYEALLPRKVDQGKLNLYIEFSATQLLATDLKKIGDSALLPYGIHLTGWENHDGDTHLSIMKLLDEFYRDPKTTKFQFGLTVANCTNEINHKMEALKSIPYFPTVKYLVCQAKTIKPSNSDKEQMQVYLDTHFYIKQYLNATFAMDTVFRLKFNKMEHPDSKAEMENYLRFLNDTNQYAEGYGITYFMGDAVSMDNDDRWSWWSISGNPQANFKLTELESEFFGRPTEQKYKVLPLKNIWKNVPLMIGLSTFSVVALITIFILWIYNRRMKKMILTRAEVNAFRNGEVIQESEESIGFQHIQVNTIKTLGFNKDFEIPKKNIELGTVIGRGNFGFVYSGNLIDGTEVAIKIPQSDCSKESFKTMLAEVKILCYIGSQSNVVSFIGAYTKEIDRGLIYIVTEFCQNGSLEKYLRKRKPRNIENEYVESSTNYEGYVTQNDHVVPTFSIDSADIHELIMFCYEISSGMEYISRKKVVHSDLSTRNVLLDSDMVCKIGDFGLSRKLYERTEYIKKGEEALPWRWMAVESLKKMEFTTQSDVWSFGVTLWEIFCFGENPYPGIQWSPNFVTQLEEGIRMSKPTLATDEIYNKMQECWNISPVDRPTFEELKLYFQNYIYD